MPKLGLGMQITKSRVRKTVDPEKELIALSSFWVDPDKPDGVKRPTGQDVNVPFINPIQDQAGNADVTLTGFAETPESGYKLETNGDKSFVMANFDGVNDYGDLVASEAPNPTGLQDFAQLVVFKPGDLNPRFYGLSRNATNASSLQYGSYIFSGYVRFRIGGVDFSLTSPAQTNLQWVFYGYINGSLFAYFNGVQEYNQEIVLNSISQPNAQLGCRVDVSEKNFYSKGTQGVVAFFYDGDNLLNKDKIVDACKKFVEKKYGL